jgi:ferric-dicitrate binding protein FerR (iron transport regulator)
MIDIRAIVSQIVQAKGASDVNAFAILTHNLVREYGQQLLVNLAQALNPSTPEETAVVHWLQGKLVEMARQIPEAVAHKQEPKA